jgi:putative transposase
MRGDSTMTTIKPEVLDELLDLTGDAGLFKQLKRALMERALGAELSHHLGYEKGDPPAGAAATAATGIRRRRC